MFKGYLVRGVVFFMSVLLVSCQYLPFQGECLSENGCDSKPQCTELTGCTPGTIDENPIVIQANPKVKEMKLQSMASCKEVASHYMEKSLMEMNRSLDQKLESVLKNRSAECRYSLYPDNCPVCSFSPGPVMATSAEDKSGVPETGATSVSGTNTQVAGVDEADFVKNDTRYLYLVKDQTLRIVKAWPADEAEEIAKVDLGHPARKLFVHNTMAIVYLSVATAVSQTDALGQTSQTSSLPYPGPAKECTYGYDCDFVGDGQQTEIAVYDLSDIRQPKKIRSLRATGSYLNSRRIGDSVFTVLSDTMPGSFAENTVKDFPEDFDPCSVPEDEVRVKEAFEALRRKNIDIIKKNYQGLDVTAMNLPRIQDQLVDGEAGTSHEVIACENYYRETGGSDASFFTTVLSFNMTNSSQPANASVIISRPGAIYASGQSLYLASRKVHNRYGFWFDGYDDMDEVTTVHKFALDAQKSDVAYAASGLVKGRVLNQFAMDEFGQHLRIATTTGHLPGANVHSTLTILKQESQNLVKSGEIDNIAPSEDIRSVRFNGKRGYIVTFKKTDPLFVLDLEHPESPKIISELKIPGFSTYMQMMDDDHILSIGYDADDQGSFAWFTGVMLQIFDVSDPENPKRAFKHVIGTRGSSSEALTNHLAFNYFASRNLLAFPMTVCEDSAGGGGYGQAMSFSGLMVFDLSTEHGFQERGRVQHQPGQNIGCHNWWTGAKSEVKRSVIMDDIAISISDRVIKFNPLNDLSNAIREISLD